MAVTPHRFRKLLLDYYAVHKRDLPWRKTKAPYNIWLSELILQQTRIEQGLPYYLRIIDRFPNVHALAEAKEQEVFKLWEGLGYYRRATYMHKTAQIVSNKMVGRFPRSSKELQKLPGIGAYTAAAIASICYDEVVPVLDGNVVRLLSRVFGIRKVFSSAQGKKIFYQLANQLIDPKVPGDYNQAAMDFGSRQCSPKKPICVSCTMRDICHAQIKGIQEELPVKKRRPAKKVRHFYYFYTRKGDQLLIRRRAESDIWKGLYELPYIESKTVPKLELAKEQLKFWGAKQIVRLELMGLNYRQLLSHQVINARFFRVDVKNIEPKAPNRLINIKNLSTFAFPKVLNWFFNEKSLT